MVYRTNGMRVTTRRFPAHIYPNLRFELVDAVAITFIHSVLSCAEQFDVAFSSATLHWVEDHPAVLGGVSRALKPGGRLLFQMGGRGNAADVVAVLDEICARDPWRDMLLGLRT